MSGNSESPSTPELTIAIISHGHARHLRGCFDSIRRQREDGRFEVWGVVNRPGDGSAELIESRYPWVRLIVNKKQKGFSENNNLVFHRTDAPYFMMLNPDTVVEKGALRRLVDFMEATPEAGASAPKLLYPDGRLQLSCRNFPTLRSALVRRTPLRRLFPGSRLGRDYAMADWDHGRLREVDWAFGACLLIRRSAMEAVGDLDERFKLYCEDIDWCYRARRMGWKVYYVPEAVVRHDLIDGDYDQYFSIHGVRHYRAMFQYLLKRAVEGARVGGER